MGIVVPLILASALLSIMQNGQPNRLVSCVEAQHDPNPAKHCKVVSVVGAGPQEGILHLECTGDLSALHCVSYAPPSPKGER